MHLFCMSIYISGYASICLDIHLFCRSACSLFSLSGNASGNASGNLVAWLSVWRSARLLVDSSGCTWQRVWSHFGLVNNLSALLPILQAAHPVAHSDVHSARLSIWSSAGLFCCLQAAISSICLFHRPGVNPSFHLQSSSQGFIHLTDTQAKSRSVSSSANL